MPEKQCAECGKTLTDRRRTYCDAECRTRAAKQARAAARAAKETEARDRRDAAAKAQFLAALRGTGIVTMAVTSSRASRATAYRWRDRDPDFAAAWDDALEEARDRLETEAWRWVFTGIPEPQFHGGRLVVDDAGEPIQVFKKSERLLIELLRANRPAKFRANHRVEVSGHVGLGLDVESEEWLAKLAEMGAGEGSVEQRLANALAADEGASREEDEGASREE